MPVETNWEFWIVSATMLCGAIIVLYWVLNGFKKRDKSKPEPALLDFSKSFFPILLFVVVLRSFIAEPFRIPSGSMIPTLEIGDFILVKKYAYGIRLPIIHTKVLDIAKPERGDVVVFRFPPDPKINYIKRLVGLPGDSVKWTEDKKLFINGKQVTTQTLEDYTIKNKLKNIKTVTQLSETLPDDEAHNVIYFPGRSPLAGEWTVPENHYFMMGDNRDKSSDGRVWGFVPEENLVGKASLVWMHWNWQEGGDGFQASRMGTAVN